MVSLRAFKFLTQIPQELDLSVHMIMSIDLF